MRYLFPQDPTTFVFQGPNQPILTAPRTGIELFVEPTADTRADVLHADDESPIANSTIYTGDEGMVPDFLGPEGVARLWARAAGSTETYPIEARFTDVIAALAVPSGGVERSLVAGHGAPGPGNGIVGGFYLDQDSGQLWGPKVDADSWPNQPFLLGGDQGPHDFQYAITVPAAQVTVDHPLHYPGVTYLNSEDVVELCDVAYPSPSRVVVGFGSPSTGRLLFT